MNLTSLIQTYGLGTVDTSVPTKPDLQYSYTVTYMVNIWACMSFLFLNGVGYACLCDATIYFGMCRVTHLGSFCPPYTGG